METTTEQQIFGITNLRAKLGQKAKLEPKFRFYTLYHHICKIDVLWLAWHNVKRNGGSAGIDGMTIQAIEKNGVEEFLKEIQTELKSKAYHPKPVKRVYIPKSDGKLRPLGLPTIKDRIVQAAVVLIIEPIFEEDFLECSLGWGNYFKLGHPGQAFNKLNSHVQKRMYKFLQRRSQKGFKKPNREQSWYSYLKELGIKQLTKRAFQVNA